MCMFYGYTTCVRWVCQGAGVRWGVPGVGAGGHYREGIPGGYYPGPHIGIARAQPLPVTGITVSPRHSRHPPGAFRTPGLPHPQIPRLRLIRARFRRIYPKVSQNGKVSPKSVHEACHTPYIKKRSKCHDLEFSGFPIWPAFSR